MKNDHEQDWFRYATTVTLPVECPVTDEEQFKEELRTFFRPAFEWLARLCGYDIPKYRLVKYEYAKMKVSRICATRIVPYRKLQQANYPEDMKTREQRGLRAMVSDHIAKHITITASELKDFSGIQYEASIFIARPADDSH